MALLNEAYEVLSNPELKQRFDNGEGPMDPMAGQGPHSQLVNIRSRSSSRQEVVDSLKVDSIKVVDSGSILVMEDKNEVGMKDNLLLYFVDD